MRKNKYPANRRPKTNTDYALSTKVIKQIGKDKISEIFNKKGMYLASKEISNIFGAEVTPWITRYIRNKMKKGRIENEEG